MAPPPGDVRHDNQAELLDFPSELGTLLFGLVAAESWADIAACRVVSRSWAQHSSPFLVKTAVVAERPRAIAKLCQIMEHPYFRNYVTTLIWDASWYVAQIANSKRGYYDEVAEHESPHLRQ